MPRGSRVTGCDGVALVFRDVVLTGRSGRPYMVSIGGGAAASCSVPRDFVEVFDLSQFGRGGSNVLSKNVGSGSHLGSASRQTCCLTFTSGREGSVGGWVFARSGSLALVLDCWIDWDFSGRSRCTFTEMGWVAGSAVMVGLVGLVRLGTPLIRLVWFAARAVDWAGLV